MIRNTCAILTILFLGLVLSSCKVILSPLTKNWKKELINIQTDNYKVVINLNLSQGCPQSMSAIGDDTILFNNSFLPRVIMYLTNRSSNRIDFVNMNYHKDNKIDIFYYSQKNQKIKSNNDTLLNILSKQFEFSVSKDSTIKKIYKIKINDENKLSSHLDNTNKPHAILSKNKFEVYGYTLPSIFKELEGVLKIFIDFNLNDPNKYNMIIPINTIDNSLIYFSKKCGIEFIETEKKVEIIKVRFNDQE